MPNNYIDETKDDLFNALNADPFSSGGGNDGRGGIGSSIFDNNNDPFSNNSQPISQPKQNTGIPSDPLDLFIYVLQKAFTGLLNLIIGGGITLKSIFEVLPNKTADTIKFTAKAMLCTFIPISVIGAALLIFGYISETTLAYMGYTLVVAGVLDSIIAAAGLTTISIMSKGVTKEELITNIENSVVTDKEASKTEDEIVKLANDYDQSFDDIMNEILGSDEFNSSNDTKESVDTDDSSMELDWSTDDTPDTTDTIEEKSEDITINMPKGIINTASLFESLYKIFPAYNPNFDKITKFEQGSKKWEDLYAIIACIFKDLYGLDDVSDVIKKGIKLLSVEDAIMFTRLTIKKPSGAQKKPEQIEEITNNYSTDLVEILVDPKRRYTGSNAEDKNKMSCSAKIDGDKIILTITKPNKDPILLGDVMMKKEVQDLYRKSNNIPLLLGVDTVGNPITYEMGTKGQEMYSGTFAGGPGSGKSWFFMSIIIQLLAFYLPEMVQMILVDPKGDAMFNKFELHPNVCRLIQGDNPKTGRETFNMIKTLIAEGTRRQELFATENTANIQGWRKKGHKMPTIFCFIDEIPTLIGDIRDWQAEDEQEALDAYNEDKKNNPKPQKLDYVKDWNKMIAQAVTKLRSSGIYVYVIAQRLTGYVDKTFRDLTPMKLVLRSMELMSQVFDEKDTKGFTKVLINAGEAALKLGEAKMQYCKTLGVCIEDDKSYEIIEALAKEFYKMGVEIPDMSVLGKEYVKDLKKIRAELYNENIIQFDENTDVNSNSKADEFTEENEEDDKIVSIDKDGTIHTKSDSNSEEDEDDPDKYDEQEDANVNYDPITNDDKEDTDDDFDLDFDENKTENESEDDEIKLIDREETYSTNSSDDEDENQSEDESLDIDWEDI